MPGSPATAAAPPTRLTRWAAPGLVALFAVMGVLQAGDRPPWVLAGGLLMAAGAALVAPPDRPALLPVFAALSAIGTGMIASGRPADVGWFAICVLAGWCALVTGTGTTLAFCAAALVGFGLEWLLTVDDHGWAAWIAGTTFATFCCLLARRERDLAQRLRIAQAGLAERVRAEERNRIARELHDVLAHSLTVSLLHVSSARLAVEENPAGAVQALADAERLGRECLAEVRQVVGLLRDDGGGIAAPLPGADQLGPLVERFRSAGAEVSLTVAGDPARLTAGAGLAVHRILQEALTNAARHAPGAPVRAALSVSEAGTVLVVDSGGPPGSGTGGGLMSMRERAEMLGGNCAAGPCGGGWRVRAELPTSALTGARAGAAGR